MTPPSTELPFSRALKLGLGQAMSRPAATLGMGLCRAVDALCGVAISAAVIGGAVGNEAGLPAFIGLAVASGLSGAVMRAVILGGGLRQGAAAMREQPVPTFGAATSEAARRSFVYAAVSVLLDFLARAWVWLALGTSMWLFIRALLFKEGGALGSAAVAFTLTVAMPLLLGVSLVTEVGFARATARSEPYAVALYEAVGTLWRRPWTPLSLFALYAVISSIFSFTVSAMVNAASSGDPFGPTVWSLMLAGQTVAAILGAMIAALFDHARAQSLLALELDAAEPLPKPPAPIPLAPLIPVAQIVPVAPVIPVAPIVPPTDPDGGAQ